MKYEVATSPLRRGQASCVIITDLDNDPKIRVGDTREAESGKIYRHVEISVSEDFQGRPVWITPPSHQYGTVAKWAVSRAVELQMTAGSLSGQTSLALAIEGITCPPEEEENSDTDK